jgi:glutathione S-transferase
VANVNNLDIEFVHTEPAKGVSDDYRLINKLGLVPSFVGADNFTLTESIAIAIYRKSRRSLWTLPSTPLPTQRHSQCNDEKYYQLQLSLSEDYC